MATSYIAALVSIVMGVQSFLGLSFTSDQWTSAIIVICGIVVAIRQLITGRATLLGGRPQD